MSTSEIIKDELRIYGNFFQEVEDSHDFVYKIIYLNKEKLKICKQRCDECKGDIANISYNEKILLADKAKPVEKYKNNK